MASVKLPRQLHGRCQPIHSRPSRYKVNIVASQATNLIDNSCRSLKKQTNAMTTSAVPTKHNKFPRPIPKSGSGTTRILACPNPLHILAIPVKDKTTPALTINFLLFTFTPICFEAVNAFYGLCHKSAASKIPKIIKK